MLEFLEVLFVIGGMLFLLLLAELVFSKKYFVVGVIADLDLECDLNELFGESFNDPPRSGV